MTEQEDEDLFIQALDMAKANYERFFFGWENPSDECVERMAEPFYLTLRALHEARGARA